MGLVLSIVLIALPSIARAGETAVTGTGTSQPATADTPVVSATASADIAVDTAPSFDIKARMRQMDSQLEESRARVAALEKRVSSLEEKNRYLLGAAGFGLSMPTSGGGGAAMEVTANIKFLSAYYYVAKGGGAALNLPLTIGNRVTIRPLGLGFMYYESADTFSSRWFQRSVDLTVPVGVDVRIWMGITATVQVEWFLPNPVDVASASGDAGKASLQKLDPNFPAKAGDVISKAYGDAVTAPRIEIFAKWAF
jgi:hypothetical protein